MKTYSERLLHALLSKGISQSELARRIGVKPQAIQYLCKQGKNSVHSSKIANALGVSVDWLTEGKGNKINNYLDASDIHQVNIVEWDNPDDLPPGKFALVPRVLVNLSAGEGIYTTEEEGGEPLAFTTKWIKDKGVKRSNLVCVNSIGDSMEPTIADGALLLVDVGQKDVIDGKVYAIRYGDDLRVKRLYKRFDGGIIIRSDNRNYQDEELSPDDMNDHIFTIGRVIWQAGDVF